MTTYYVRKTGNDSTGDGSTGNPWLTISKALATVSTAGGHTIMVGDGTYEEDTSGLGYLFSQRQFVDFVTVQPELGAIGAVTLSGSTSAVYSLRFDVASHIRLKWLTLATATPLTFNYGILAFTGASGSYFEFINCAITVAGREDTFAWACFLEVATAGRVFSNILFENCTIRQSGTGFAHGLRFDTTAAGASIDTVTVKNCDIQVDGDPIRFFDRVTNILIDGGTYICTGVGYMAVMLGNNANTGSTVTGLVKNVYAWSKYGHSLLVGAGCAGVTVQDSWCDGGDQGVVVKQSSNTILLRNYIAGGTLNALYFKAAVGATATQNTIVNRTGNVVKIGYDSGNNDKCENINFQNNIIIAMGDGTIAMDWGDSTDDAGGGICDYNYYGLRGTNNSLSVRAGTGLTTIAEVQAAWSGYDVVGNDAHSGMNVYFSQADLSTVPTAAEIVAAIDADTPAVNVTLWAGDGVNDLTDGKVPANVYQVFASAHQDVADALLLAPAGVAAAGSAMDYLADIVEDTGTTLPGLITGTSTGARTIVITVNDGTDPLENARVRLTEGVNTIVGSTGVNGQVTFNRDDATYTVAITKAGYTFAGTSLTIDGNETQTYSMTAISFSASEPGQSTGWVYCYDDEGNVEADVSISVQLTATPETDSYAFDTVIRVVASEVDGLAEFTGLWIGATYRARRYNGPWYSFVVPNAVSFALPVLLGR